MNPFKNRKRNYKGSSEHLKKKFNIHKIVNARMRVFIGICLVLAGILIYRLYDVQIINAAHFEALYEIYQTPDSKYNTKRGDFVDRNGVEMVTSNSVNNFVYMPVQGLKDSERWNIAARFAEAFEVEYELTPYEIQDLWMRLNPKVDLFTEEERAQFKKDKLTSSEIEKLKRERITDELTDTISAVDQETFRVYLLMSNTETNNTATILKDASIEDIAYLAEHQEDFQGFSTQISWEREYSNDYGLGSIFGRIGQVAVEKAPWYSALNYSMNDVVGISGLEYQYEDLLKGKKSVYSKDTKYSELEQKYPGQVGNDIRLTIDTDLQVQLEKEIIAQLESIKNDGTRKYSNEMKAIVSDPNTGDILAMAAMVRRDDGTYYNDPQRILNEANAVGSVVKPVTVYMGLNEGAIQPGQVFYDSPLYIQGTPPRHSYANLGAVDDITALQVSSNVYMFYTTIALAGSTYIPNGPLIFDDLDVLMKTMRNYYSQFGLGVKTGIDYPNEEVGYKGLNTNSGLALEFAIGQYDNYTAIQLNQYVNTLANGGYRLKPRLVMEAGDLKSDRVVYENQVEILNTIDNKVALERVREGMRRCIAYGNCNGFSSAPVTAAGKTGTAQVTGPNGIPHSNHNFIAFAPFEEPQIAISCVQPFAFIDSGGVGFTNQCGVIANKMVNYYFK